MSAGSAAIRARLAELRRAFDDAFARPAEERGAAPLVLLGVRAGTGRFAVRIEELAGVHRCGRIAGLPGGPAGLLGLAGVRGRIHAVFRLSDLLGAAGSAEAPRWLLLAKAGEPIAFGVDGIDGQRRADAAALHPIEGAERGGHVRWAVQLGEERLGVISINSLLETTEQRAPDHRRGGQV